VLRCWIMLVPLESEPRPSFSATTPAWPSCPRSLCAPWRQRGAPM